MRRGILKCSLSAGIGYIFYSAFMAGCFLILTSRCLGISCILLFPFSCPSQLLPCFVWAGTWLQKLKSMDGTKKKVCSFKVVLAGQISIFCWWCGGVGVMYADSEKGGVVRIRDLSRATLWKAAKPVFSLVWSWGFLGSIIL